MKKKAVPVFMYHTVGIPNPRWKWNNLTIPYKIFEKQLAFLKKYKYETIHLSELYEYINNERAIPKKTVVLTFDDGYADNYIFAYPLLKKYGFKGTVFVNPEFVDSRNIIRKRLDETDDVVELETLGFLSWDEMRIMEGDNTIDIQSHAMTHTWYPISDEVIDFRHPDDEHWWMSWNSYPKEKPFSQVDIVDLVKFGAPVYKNEKSLMAKVFFPDDKIETHLVDFVTKAGGVSFFQEQNWKEKLFEVYNNYKEKVGLSGSYESESEYINRIAFEIRESKRIIEENLNKEVQFLCWPGGSGTKEGIIIAKEAGYKMSTAARDILPSLRKEIKNNGTIYADRIGRTSPVLITSKKNNTVTVYADGFGMYLRIIAFHKRGVIRKIINGIIIIYGRVKFLGFHYNI